MQNAKPENGNIQLYAAREVNQMDNVKSGKEKQFVYVAEYKRLSKALKEQFYLEAVAIGYAIIEDRLVAFLHHAGIVTRGNRELKINKAVCPYIKKLWKPKNNNNRICIKNIGVKKSLIEALLNMTSEQASEIDSSAGECLQGIKRKKSVAKIGYMHALFEQMNKIDREAAAAVLDSIGPWREDRNQLIHALLNKTVASAYDAKKKCAEDGLVISREIDGFLVKPFKRKNTLRKTFNIR